LDLIGKPLRFIFGVLTIASVGYYLASIIAAERFFSRGGGEDVRSRGELPGPVSVLVPLCGADFKAYQNYASLCRQDHSQFEIIFGVADPADSSLPVVAKLRADFPEVPIHLVISSEAIGPNPKVNLLNNMLAQASHETLLLLDSDIRVETDFIATICRELSENGGGLVTCLYRAGEAPGWPSKLEAVGITSDFAPGVFVAQMGGGISFAFGAAIALSQKTLGAIGGFGSISPFLADDYMLGRLVKKAGFPVKLSKRVVETVLSRLTTAGFIKHQLRWARGIRACAPWGHTGSVITNGTSLSFLYFAFSGFSGQGLLVFAAVVAVRLWMAWMVGVRRLGDDILRHNLFLAPLRDFFSLFIWSAALFGRRVEWRSRVYWLEKDGRIIPREISA
jgi:ceramide glucosyltransferase